MIVLLVYNNRRVSISDEFAWGNRRIFVEIAKIIQNFNVLGYKKCKMNFSTRA